MSGSRGSANLVMRCKFCKRESSARKLGWDSRINDTWDGGLMYSYTRQSLTRAFQFKHTLIAANSKRLLYLTAEVLSWWTFHPE